MSESSRQEVNVVPYNPNWTVEYGKERTALLKILSPHIVAIEHVGSTSIEHQDAKPIIDIFAAVKPFHNHAVYESLLSPHRYHYAETGMTGRHLFAKAYNGVRTHHLHILPIEGFYQRNQILFRDYLRAHPAFVQGYGAIKRNLAKEYHSDSDGYTRAKTAFIQRVVDLARAERGLPLENVWEE
ncbi:GrpB family protein [Alicyclobacillus fodiniaquatilis]|uniref:GrpB family protein n=1 Tax=Alicyclobacillus fodiniaquatilis TaxID=1661150 RepID=A0ABW4JJ20_9BACL